MNYSYTLNSLDDTKILAKHFANTLKPKLVIAIFGNLGYGKTTLIREILYSFGIKGSVKSPTYTLVEEYIVNDIKIFHFDLYRFNDQMEWYESGFDEYLTKDTISFIEWPEKAYDAIGEIDLKITIAMKDTVRIVDIVSQTDNGEKCLSQLITNVDS